MIDAAAAPALLLLRLIDAIASGRITRTAAVEAKIEELTNRSMADVIVTEKAVCPKCGDGYLNITAETWGNREECDNASCTFEKFHSIGD